MHLHNRIKRLVVLMLIMLFVFSGAAALADAGFVRAKNARVYADDSLTGRSVAINRYMLVDVLEVEDGVAKIEANGYTVYIAADLLTIFDPHHIQTMEFSKSARVYEYPTTRSKSAKVAKGTEVNVLHIENGAAVIEKNGVMAYTYLSALEIPEEIIYEEYEVVVTADSLPVYKSASASSAIIATLKKGDVIKLVARTDEWALIEKNGVQGCCKLSGIEKYVPDPIVYEEYEVIVTADTLKAYDSASNSGSVVMTLKKDDIVTLKARNSTWAIIEKDGKQGCCKLSGIEKYVAPKFTMDEVFASDKYTNEEKIYIFLTQEMKYSSAAACGILANIRCESTFRPTAYNPNGGSYGICQWLGGRYTNLKNFCSDNGYDYTTLEGQCYFLKHELENNYTRVHNFMKSVENTSQGAYDAGYYYCYNYEVPANRASTSVKRGNMASDDYWPKYSK